MTITNAKYLPNPFSYHFCYVTSIKTDNYSQKLHIPKPLPSFKIHPKVVDDPDFQSEINLELDKWTINKDKYGYNTVDWWESVVKPGIKYIAISYTNPYQVKIWRFKYALP